MATKLHHSIDFPCPPAQFAAAVADEQYWKDLVANVAADLSDLDSFTDEGDKVTVVLRQRVPEKNLPSMVTKIRPGDLEITRTVVWSKGEAAEGAFSAVVSCAPAKVKGSQRLIATSTGCEISFDGSVEVSIPFVGGKVEKAIAENVVQLIEAEHEYTTEWINTH
ncbi:uncharacterized protein DUF2505 [Williamsia muralis]|uniref:Uncharacterized protein DUF2505 n=1 Tax=Williamsia marianensis TaxID=85044 RepID=A0A495K6R6_WILMA|nr:DUF2505 domain-containing protein [Williamsia muralis]RKR96997.1 uncharacterized protein DUF2505 [Williamsia muralis]